MRLAQIKPHPVFLGFPRVSGPDVSGKGSGAQRVGFDVSGSKRHKPWRHGGGDDDGVFGGYPSWAMSHVQNAFAFTAT